MKKIFTILSLVLLTALSVNAQGVTWDFRNWSSKTLQALKNDLEVNGANKNWRNYETDASKADEQHYWIARKMAGTLVTNDGAKDTPITETEGLTFGASSAKKLVISYNHGNRTEHGQFIWLNGKNETITAPNITGNQTLKFAVESHSTSEKRGVTVTFNGNTLTSPTGNFTPIEYTEYEVTLPEGTGDLVFKSTNGCHIFYIIVGDGGEKKVINYNIGYLYYDTAGDGFAELPLYKAISDMENATFEGINMAKSADFTKLSSYDAIVIDGSIPVNATITAVAPIIKQNLQWMPVVNVNGALAEALGYGTVVKDVESELGYVLNTKKNWFSGFEAYSNTETNEVALTNGEIMPEPLVLTGHAGDTKYIAWGKDDKVCNDSVLGYVHNSGHNEYVYFGAKGDYAEGIPTILKNIISDAVSSKSEITATTKPTIKGSYKEMESNITISCVNKNAVIYYTTDGTDPTTESTVYTEPLTFTSEVTVKAVSIAEGYTLSDVSSFDVKLYHQAKKPTITTTGDEANGNATITLASEDGDNAKIWYNFTASTDTTKSSKYTGPITIKHAATITAFAVGATPEAALVQSESATADVKANMNNVRCDQVAHFNASGWNTLANLTLNGEVMTAWGTSNYYFKWGKTAATSYTTSDEPETDNDGNPKLDENNNPIMKKTTNTPDTTKCTTDTDWELISAGQVMIYQGNTLGTNVGDFSGYNPEKAEDLIGNYATNNCVQFGAIASSDVYTANIQSTKAYAGPFNVVTCIANVNGDKTTGVGKPCKVGVQISKDGKTWEMIGDTLTTSDIFRNYKTFEVAYNGTDEVYVRLASINGSSQAVHDIYIFNHGEKSIAEEANGISDIKTSNVAVIKAVKFVENGKLVIKTANGTYTATGARIK